MNREMYTTTGRYSSQDYFGGAGPIKSSIVSPPNPRFSPVQFRNVNVGMFSGRRPSYQRYSASPAAADVMMRVGPNGR